MLHDSGSLEGRVTALAPSPAVLTGVGTRQDLGRRQKHAEQHRGLLVVESGLDDEATDGDLSPRVQLAFFVAHTRPTCLHANQRRSRAAQRPRCAASTVQTWGNE